MSVEIIKEQARKLAEDNKKAEPKIEKIYWFPSKKEIHLLELEENIIPALDGRVDPFYFRPSPEDGYTFPYGIAIIRPLEFGKLKLPRRWGKWDDAEELVV